MIRSLYTGESGIKSHQTRMDVIGNNVANVNTAGFKAGRGDFSDILSQTLKGATASNGNIGSTNSVQIGLGSRTSAIDLMFRNGSIQSTGKNTDLALSGDGLFVVRDGVKTYYTRSGDFGFDSAGNLVQNGTGLFVQGYMATEGTITPGGEPTNINIPIGKEMPGTETEEEAATLIGVDVDQSGNIIGRYSNGQTQLEAQVALATFSNPQGLLKEGNSLYMVSGNSGAATYGTSETTGTRVTPSALEMSNVDIANEFSDMIVTQRGFQSNSKVITTSDENLETAVNMKR